ncbi:branched-chain amino acid ABC transporter permease [Methylobacterium sp. PvR107]|uniref:branched-chain amino acid ABC transporter permease n=1 Tax=Methylobacterium sp. PvR107 TaxID=2806597 RepID=UPI001AE27EDB|nr:branched-chain amino acid ABC transporter permease [Methylobacterium sp. PvR107]MBP1178063.1 ABC-type branched-subunit amino acid transport system permease subunit [Methylobacterium sp. PvR107]
MTAYLVTILVIVAIATLVGLALNFQWGCAGLVNFGVAGFVALGAYATALLTPVVGWFAAMLAAAALSALLSVFLALLSIRLADDYLAIVTLGFGEAVRLVLLNEGWLTGGALGIAGIPRPFASLIAPEHADFALLGFAVALVGIVYIILEALVRSPFGRVLRALRDDPVVAASLAKPVLILRIKAFAVGGAVMGLAGAMHAFYMTYIDPSQFTAITTSYAFMAVIAGGRGSNTGLMIGAGTIMLLLEGTRFLKDLIPALDGAQIAALRLGGVGVGIVLLLLLRPQGLLREPQRKAASLLADPERADAADPSLPASHPQEI